jgi:hypothetical protein
VERQRIARVVAPVQEGRALLEWVNRTRTRLPHEASVRLFLKKVMKEEMKRSTAQWAMGRAGDSQGLVILHGITALDRASPPHWN